MNSQRLEEIKRQLIPYNTFSKCKIKFDDTSYLFTKNKEHNYWLNRRENIDYGLAICSDGTVIYGYPHLENIKDTTEFKLENCILEKKENGTCIIISSYNNTPIIRTRMSIFTEEFPIPTFWNETINAISDESLRNKILQVRAEMTTKYPEWYVYEANGEYVGLKYQKVVNNILDINKLTSENPNLVFYFELIGRINPVIIDSEIKYGLYDFDYDIVLFDIFDKKDNCFAPRKIKESFSKLYNLKLVPVVFDFSCREDLYKALPVIKAEADKGLIEGYVLKNGIDIVKVKSDVVLDSAHRLDAILKGYIDIRDIYNYISKVVTVEHLKYPEKFDELVELIQEEAKADYPEDIVQKQHKQIQRRIAHQMAIFVADDIIKEKTFTDSGELFRYLNLEIPKRFSPLKSYIDFEQEKATEDKKLREKMKRIRNDLFGVVAKYVMRTLKINRGAW